MVFLLELGPKKKKKQFLGIPKIIHRTLYWLIQYLIVLDLMRYLLVCSFFVCQFLSFSLFVFFWPMDIFIAHIWCNILEFTRDCAKLKVVWGLWLLELIDLALWAIIEEPGEPSISWKMPGGGNTKAPKQHWHLLLCSVNELCSTFAKKLIFCLLFRQFNQ